MPAIVIIPIGGWVVSMAVAYFVGRDKGRSDGALAELAADVAAARKNSPPSQGGKAWARRSRNPSRCASSCR